jgi:type II secretory pathway pseudopilin PulG
MMKLIVLLLIAINWVSTVQAAEARKVVGQLGMVEGEVLIDSRTVKKNAPVHEGSTIEVKDGKATLLLGKGSVFHLAQDTKMVVNEFGVKPKTNEEGGELDLRFGRTRALILNQGNEKKDLRIKARAATMGVRGTEIFIDAPKESSKPVQFFTLEGKAEVRAFAQAPTVAVNQNQGVSTSGESATTASKANPSAPVAVSAAAINEVKSEIKSSGMEDFSGSSRNRGHSSNRI